MPGRACKGSGEPRRVLSSKAELALVGQWYWLLVVGCGLYFTQSWV